MAKMGRKKIVIDWAMVDDLIEIHCTAEEIAGVTKVSTDTYLKRCKKLYKVTFAEYIKRGAMNGNASLRRLQWKSANSGSVVMQIWLGKQYLKQKDRENIDLNINNPMGALFEEEAKENGEDE